MQGTHNPTHKALTLSFFSLSSIVPVYTLTLASESLAPLRPGSSDRLLLPFRLSDGIQTFQTTSSSRISPMAKWMEKRWRMITIGPTLPSMYLDKRLEGDENYSINLYKLDNAAYMKWLDTKPTGSVVYISFGSLVELSEEHMEELACGIRGSNKYFLWVVREIEKKKLPAKLIEDMEDKGIIVTWCKQIEVLAHDAVGCFVTHCGWNSTMEALCLGVPMVCMPQWTDQPTNAKFVVDVWGVGVRLKVDDKGIVRRDEMESCIREVMEGERSEEIKRNAKKWKELSNEAMDEGGSSNKNIDEFVASLLKT